MIELLRRLIQEELGRDLESPRPDPLDWKSFPGVHVMITADPVGNVYIAQVKVDDRDDLSTPARRFKSENDAMFWARNKAEIAYKSLVNSPGFTHNRPKFS
jgi:hypothetical protein